MGRAFVHGSGDEAARGAPLLSLTLWPHRSLSRRGSSAFLLLFASCLTIPLLPLVGSAAGWALLPFLVAVLLSVYAALRRSYADGRLVEELRLWPDLITVVRREPRGAVLRWDADPSRVQVRLVEDARIEKYLTLRGNGREIELGTFLSPEERQQIHRDLLGALGRLPGGAARPMPG